MVDVDQRVAGAADQAVRQRNYRRARERALTRLGRKFPEVYAKLLEEERARDEAEGKVWLDISGRTNSSVGLPTAHKAGRIPKGPSNSGKEGDLGGEE